jgi:dTDP-4-dehydrorhamnose 3,5-epimerase
MGCPAEPSFTFVGVWVLAAKSRTMKMHIERLEIPDILLAKPNKHTDQRGFFRKTFRADILAVHGIEAAFVQDNQVHSVQKNVLRGLHFQRPPHAQGKLIRCTRGAILDITVDIRVGSPTYAHHVAVELSATNWLQLWIPPGFAHGYMTLERDCEVIYKATDYYAPECDCGIAWNDPALAIDWRLPDSEIILSDKDRRQPCLADVAPAFQYKC